MEEEFRQLKEQGNIDAAQPAIQVPKKQRTPKSREKGIVIN